MNRRDQASTFADTEIRTRGQHKLGLDEDVPFWNVTVRISQHFDVPITVRVLNLRAGRPSLCAEKPSHAVAQQRGPIQRTHFLGKSANRLLSNDFDDPLEPSIFGRMKVDDVP